MVYIVMWILFILAIAAISKILCDKYYMPLWYWCTIGIVSIIYSCQILSLIQS
jgi:phosphate starvation-inducible membrane PsiE